MNAKRGKRPIIRGPFVIALLAAVAIGGAVGGYRYFSSRPTLAGQQEARLGEVLLDVDPETGALRGEASHVFLLTNNSRAAVNVLDVRSSCGCTVPSIERNIVEPGQVLEVSATIHLDRPGLRTSEVLLHFEDSKVQTLALEAIGRSRHPLRADPHWIELQPDRAVTVRIMAEVSSDQSQPQLSVRASEGIDVQLKTWAPWRPADEARHVPATWAGAVQVSAAEDADVDDDAIVEIVLDEEHTLRVPVTLHREPLTK